MMVFSVLATVLSFWFLTTNSKRIRLQTSMIVRVEQIMGLFSEKLFLDESDLTSFNNLPYAEPSVYPKKTQRWGIGGWGLLFTPHTLGVMLAGLTTCLVLALSSLPEKVEKKSKEINASQVDTKSPRLQELREKQDETKP